MKTTFLGTLDRMSGRSIFNTLAKPRRALLPREQGGVRLRFAWFRGLHCGHMGEDADVIRRPERPWVSRQLRGRPRRRRSGRRNRSARSPGFPRKQEPELAGFELTPPAPWTSWGTRPGRLLLVTLAEVRLESAALCRHQLREVCDSYMRMPSETTASVSSPADDERRCVAGFCLAILNGVGGGAGAPWRSRRRRAGQSSSLVLACIIGALRPWMAPMISSDEIPSR